MLYRYDGTFCGFLSAVYEAYYDGTGGVEGILPGPAPAALFSAEKDVETDPDHAERVAAAFYDACGGAASRWLYRGFLAEAPGREAALFTYLRRGFRLGRGLCAHRAEPWVWTVFSWAQKTGNAAEKLRGLVRFGTLEDGLYYAEISPDCDVLPLLALHFRRRLVSHAWAVHDIRRKRAACWDGETLVLADVPERSAVAYSGDERTWRRRWRTYYRHIAVEERINPALRRSFMPEKYWKHLPEIAGEDSAL